MNQLIKNPEFVKRMIVDAQNTSDLRSKFLKGDNLTNEDFEAILKITPKDEKINWGPTTISMVPWTGIEHVQKCVEDVINKNVDGDFVETGAWRGGSCILAKATINSLKSNKKVFVVDSFEGLPKPDLEKYPDDKNDTHYLDNMMKASLDTVKDNFSKFDLLDDNVVFVKGWFKDTLPDAPIGKISVLRLDGDMYESTIDVLANLYHKLSVGGYCVIDDYFHKACRAAIHDFRVKNGITEKIVKVDSDSLNEVHYWVKEKETIYKQQDYPSTGLVKFIYNITDTIWYYTTKIILKLKK